MATGLSLNDIIKLPALKTTRLVQEPVINLLYKASYSQYGSHAASVF